MTASGIPDSRSLRRICLAVAVVAGGLIGRGEIEEAGQGQSGFSVLGRATWQGFAPDGREAGTATVEFAVGVSGNTWSIRENVVELRYGPGAGEPGGARTITFDGRDLYRIVELPTGSRTVRPEFPTHASVSEAMFPAASTPVQRILWLAYCSAAALRRGGTEDLPVLCDPPGKLPAPPVREWQVNPSSGLPMIYRERVAGRFGLQDRTNTVWLTYPAPLDQGREALVQRTTALTNRGGVELPLAVVKESYGVDTDFTNYARPYLASRWLVEATQFDRLVGPVTPGEIPGTALVHDRRFTNHSGTTLTYRQEAGRFLGRDSATEDVASAQARRVRPRGAEPPGVGALVRWLLIAVVVAGPAAFLWSRLRFQNRRAAPPLS